MLVQWQTGSIISFGNSTARGHKAIAVHAGSHTISLLLLLRPHLQLSLRFCAAKAAETPYCCCLRYNPSVTTT